jgi:TetR/AcrR family transcriptional regulator, repressor of fatR-cypB operon
MAGPLPFYIHEGDPTAKRAILRAAMKLFSERGLAATSIRDIAEQSGFTNPALYKHFAGKGELALYLFEACHGRVWTSCAAALGSANDFSGKLDAYVRQWLALWDDYPDVLAFLADSARVLWPKSCASVRRQTMIGLARSLVAASPQSCRGASALNLDLAAANLQGTLTELARMIQVGVVDGPAKRWQSGLVALFQKSLA